MEEIAESVSGDSVTLKKNSSVGDGAPSPSPSGGSKDGNFEADVSLGGIQRTASSTPELKEIFPSDDLVKDESLPAICAMFGQTLHECVPTFHKNASNEAPVEMKELTSGEKVALKVFDELVTKAVKFSMPKRVKAPVMKSGFMYLQDVIPDFNIDDATFDDILFRENLLVSVFEEHGSYPTPVGALSLGIESARGGPLRYKKKTRSDYLSPKFLVHVASHLDFHGHNGGSKITAWIDRDLQTLEESRKEFIRLDAHDVDRQSLYVNAQEDFYYLRHNKERDIVHSAQRARNLICEGSDFVLMRYLATKRFIGTFEVPTLYINGDLCRNIYKCNGPQSGIIYNKKIDVCKIYRTIIERCGIQHKSITLMTLGGRILKQEWDNCNYILQVNPLIDVGVKPSPHERVPLDKAFEEDIQLLSLYLDAKTISKKRIENYMNDHPEIRSYISDYVQTILQLKPENVIEFSAKYFLGFTPQLLPYSEYFEPSQPGEKEDAEFWKYF